MRQHQTRHDATPLDLDRLDFEKGGGLVTVVAQDAISGMVLMVAHADREALERTLATGEMHYRSRTRGLWHKGATSGHVQHVISLHHDCDGDAVLALVRADGPACHTGASSCFSGALPAAGGFAALDGIIAERARAMADSGPLVVHHAELQAATARRPQPSAQEAWRGSDRAHRRVCR